MTKKAIIYMTIGICCLLIPTIIYLCFLIPQLSERYNILMASGGAIAGGGLYGAEAIPDKVKYSGLFKLSARSFTLLTVTVLVNEFILKIIGLIAVIIISFILFSVFKELYKNERRRKANNDLANAIARSIIENS